MEMPDQRSWQQHRGHAEILIMRSGQPAAVLLRVRQARRGIGPVGAESLQFPGKPVMHGPNYSGLRPQFEGGTRHRARSIHQANSAKIALGISRFAVYSRMAN